MIGNPLVPFGVRIPALLLIGAAAFSGVLHGFSQHYGVSNWDFGGLVGLPQYMNGVWYLSLLTVGAACRLLGEPALAHADLGVRPPLIVVGRLPHISFALMLCHDEEPVVIQQRVHALDHLGRRQVDFVNDQPLAAFHRLDEYAVLPDKLSTLARVVSADEMELFRLSAQIEPLEAVVC